MRKVLSANELDRVAKHNTQPETAAVVFDRGSPFALSARAAKLDRLRKKAMRTAQNCESHRALTDSVLPTNSHSPFKEGTTMRAHSQGRHTWILGYLSLAFLFIAALPVAGYCQRDANAIQFVSAHGRNTNDGLTWQTAKATIPAAYAALPACSINGLRWQHCGEIEVGAGRFKLSQPLVIESPYVWLRGRGAVVTQLRYTKSSGCGVVWTSTPYNTGLGKTYAGGLFDLTLEGPGQAARGGNACGLETVDIVGFQMHGVSIQNFSGACWWDHAVRYWNERFKISAELSDCGYGWRITADESDTVYPNATFGYGNFALWINTFPGQVGVDESAGVVSYSNLHIIENMNGGTAIRLRNSAQWFANLLDLHFEGPAVGFDIDRTSRFQGVGIVNSGLPNNLVGSYSVQP